MATTSLTAGQVMDRAASLMNDTAKTDYTYVAMLPYLNMAIDELLESLEESNGSPTSQMSSTIITIEVGVNKITSTTPPVYPATLVEVQEVGERLAGSQDSFIRLSRREFLSASPPNNSLLAWSWENQVIKFNPNGALTRREIELKYVAQPIVNATNETSIIGIINSISFLSYKTAALCSQFIGENESRAEVLEGKANEALERLTGINNKGKQQIMTRHRPFRAAYKSRMGSY